MRHLCIAATFITLASSSLAQDKKAPGASVYLAVDTGGHAGPVLDMAFTPDGNRLVSIEERTVHVWNLASGERERTWRLPGQALEKVAVSPDGVTIAVATSVDVLEKYRKQVSFWILDVHTGAALVHHEERITRQLTSMEFSPDGKRLAWSCYYQAGVMDHLHKKGRITHLIELEESPGAASFSPDGNQLLVTGGMKKGKQCHVYNVSPPESPLKSVRNVKKPVFDLEDSRPQKVLPHEWKVLWAPDGSRFASWDEDPVAIHLWSADGKRETTGAGSVRKIALKGLPQVDFLQFTGPKKLLAAAIAEFDTDNLRVRLIDLDAPKEAAYFQLPVRLEQPPRLAVSPQGRYLAINSGPGFQIFVYDLENRKLLLKLGKSQPFPKAVAWGPDSRSIAWAFHKNKTDDWNLTAGLNLNTLEPLESDQVRGFTFGRKPLKWKHEGKDEYITLIHEGKIVKTELRGPVRGVSYYKDAADRPHAVLHQAWGGEVVHLVNLETGKTNRLVADVQRFSVSPDQRYLLVVRGEQTVQLFRIDAKPAQVMKVLVFGSDWIAWSPRGFYAASVGGEELMGWSVKSNEETPLAFYPLERFRKQYHRPDIIKLLLEKGSGLDAEKAANAAAGIATNATELEDNLPPIVTFEVDDTKKPLLKVKVSARAQTRSQPITALRLFIDYQSVMLGEFKEGRAAVKDLIMEATLPGEKPNAPFRLTVMAESKDGYGVSNSIDVEYIDQKKLPTMHVLSVGINEYDVKAFKLNCAAADAAAILANLQKSGNGLFKDVVGKTLLNQQAERQTILTELAQLQKKVNENDLLVVFFAGHGVKDKDDFYLMTRESRSENLTDTAISGSQLRRTLAGFRCQVLLLLDACHSGAFGNRKQGVPGALAGQNLRPATDAAAHDLTDETRNVAVLTAARGAEKAQEKNGHGLFTEAIVRALNNGPGVRLRNRVLFIHNLYTYVLDEVAEASEGEQHPYLGGMSELVLPFAVAKFAPAPP